LPGVLKFTVKPLVPVIQKFVLLELKLFPSVPEMTVQPVAGEICQTNFPGMQDPLLISLFAPVLFVKITLLVVHTVSLGDISNVGVDFCET